MKKADYFLERYRPQVHYSAQSHIINDPNGLFYYEGEYHLMHQYNIHNHIHWGHAVSKDLVHWEHLPPALCPDSIGQIWSGSAVVDWNNTSGLQVGHEKVIVALFTYNEHVDAAQSQGMAYSRDRGRTWHKYHRNPVLTSGGKKDFRDPKVFWHGETKAWVMVLACHDHVEFFRSPNLIDWAYAGEFGRDDGSHVGVWECPDLFRMPVEGAGQQARWVLLVSVNAGAPAGGTGMQYFVGDFDGSQFVNGEPKDNILWLDYGKDCYAGVTWNDIPEKDGRRLMVAWADNWLYRDALPTEPFKGQFTSVRQLILKTHDDGYRLHQSPVSEMGILFSETQTLEAVTLSRDTDMTLPVTTGAFRFDGEFRFPLAAGEIEICLSSGQDDYVSIAYDRKAQELRANRNHSGEHDIENFRGEYTAPLALDGDTLDIQIVADTSQLEVFAGGGSRVMTCLYFPKAAVQSVTIRARGEAAELANGAYHGLRDVWTHASAEPAEPNQIIAGHWADTALGLEGDHHSDGMLLSSSKYRDFALSVLLTIMPYRDGSKAGVVFGANENDAGYALTLDADGKIIRLQHEELTVCDIAFPVNLQRCYRLDVTVTDCELNASIDGVAVMQKQLDHYTEGTAGLLVVDTNALFNKVKLGYSCLKL